MSNGNVFGVLFGFVMVKLTLDELQTLVAALCDEGAPRSDKGEVGE